MKVVKLKIVEQDLKVEWKCPTCDKINVEYHYNRAKEETIYCYGCGEHFRGEIEKEGER